MVRPVELPVDEVSDLPTVGRDLWINSDGRYAGAIGAGEVHLPNALIISAIFGTGAYKQILRCWIEPRMKAAIPDTMQTREIARIGNPNAGLCTAGLTGT